MVQILDENSFFLYNREKMNYRIQWSRDNTKDDSRSSHANISTTDEQVDAIQWMILDDRHFTV